MKNTKEFTVSKEELTSLFKEKKLQDRNNGWFYEDKEVDIIALHNKETKYISNIFNADYYRIKKKSR